MGAGTSTKLFVKSTAFGFHGKSPQARKPFWMVVSFAASLTVLSISPAKFNLVTTALGLSLWEFLTVSFNSEFSGLNTETSAYCKIGWQESIYNYLSLGAFFRQFE